MLSHLNLTGGGCGLGTLGGLLAMSRCVGKALGRLGGLVVGRCGVGSSPSTGCGLGGHPKGLVGGLHEVTLLWGGSGGYAPRHRAQCL